MRRIDGLLLAASVAISCGEGKDAQPTTHNGAARAQAAAEEIAPATNQHWCLVTGEGSEIKTAPCYDDEAQCKLMFAKVVFYPVIEPCHFRSPVFCYDYLRDDGPNPQCFASMKVCAGHWEVSRRRPDRNGEVGPGCTERR